jgi:hypothetical protein
MTDTMRDSINAALDTADEDYEETPQEVETYEAEEETETEAEAEEEVAEPAPADDGGEHTEVQSTDTAPTSGDSIKAPLDWGPQERESWSKIPRNLQEKVMAREKDYSKMMESTASARRTHDDFGKLAQQYGSVLSGVAGDTPMEAVGNLFNTVANLRMGSPIQKAQIIADMIGDFGVDINTLDSAIVGQAPPAAQTQNAEIERIVAERMAPFEEMRGQQNAYKQQQAQQTQANAQKEVQTFSKDAEFLSDVRYDMADLIDMADKQGRDISMQEAYDKACMLNPQIQSVIQQRTQQQQLTGSSNTMSGKRNAASSITGNRGGVGGGSGGGSMREMLSAAWDGQDKV